MGACESKKASKAALKKHRMENLPKLKNQVNGTETNSSKSQPSLRSAGVATKKASKEGDTNVKVGSASVEHKDRRVKSLREVPTRKTVLIRSATDARATAKPSKALHKNSSVSPAPSRAPPKHLNRFGFKTSIAPLTSGDSTDSVNSILSDAKSISDLNLNTACEENGNFAVTNPSRDVDDKSDVLSSISQASSGVTSCITGKLKTKTKQLPQPIRPSTFVRHYQRSQVNRNATSIHSNFNARIKSSHTPVAVHASSGWEAKFQSKDTESDKNSKIESKSEVDTLSVVRLLSGEPPLVNSCCTNRDSGVKLSSDFEINEIPSFEVTDIHKERVSLRKGDVSDAWLCEKKNSMKMKLDAKQTVPFHQKISQEQKHKDDITGKDVGKEKKDGFTYGAAREKIAPYTRSRFGFGFPSAKTQTASKVTVTKSNSGVVKNRIAQLEKKPKGPEKFTKNTEDVRIITGPKKAARPTTFEKPLPIPLTTETIELSKPVYRKLHYTEGKKTCMTNTTRNAKNTNTDDVLIVSSIEKKPELSLFNGENAEEKCVNDEKQTEKSVKLKSIFNKSREKLTDRPIHSKNVPSQKITNKAVSSVIQTKKEIVKKSMLPNSENSSKNINSNKIAKVQCTKEPVVISNKSISTVQKVETALSSSNALKKGVQTNDKIPSDQQSAKEFTKSTNHDFTNLESGEVKSKQEIKSLVSSTTVTSPIVECPESAINVTDESDLNQSRLSSVMTSSTESTSKSSSTESTSKSSSSLGLSGKCTPTMGGHKSEMNQDFFIEDEISDQPGLMLGDAVDLSYLDDNMFGEEISSPSHMAIPDNRSRAESEGTLTSIGEDLILDFDTDDTKYSCSGILSPLVSEVDISAFLVNESSVLSRCISKEGLDTVLVNENAPVNTRQPISNGLPSSLSESSPRRTSSEVSYQRQVDSVGPERIVLNLSTAQSISQDVINIKSLLLNLYEVLNTPDFGNPLNGETKRDTSKDLAKENLDLHIKLIRMEEDMTLKSETISRLNQKLAMYEQLNKPLSSSQVSSTVMNSSMVSSCCSDSTQNSNAATQTDRSSYKVCGRDLSRTASVEDGFGPTVSSSDKIQGRSPVKGGVRPESHRQRNSLPNQNCPFEVIT